MQDLRQQQDEAYEESLRADQEKERLKQMERDRILQQQLQEEAERMAKQREKEVGDTFPLVLRHTLMQLKINFELRLLGYCETKD